MARRFVETLARTALLFVLSVILVLGFWYHREFYQYGLYALLVVGGLVTFLVISAARLAFSGELPRGRAAAELTFTLEEGDRILRHASDLLVRPTAETTTPPIGRVVRARYETGPAFARLLILDGTRKFVADLSEEDAKAAGFRTSEELRRAGGERWHWSPEDVVTLVRFRLLGGRA